jgi:CDP-diacylglycerol---serine O-phosphatidyltransferase
LPTFRRRGRIDRSRLPNSRTDRTQGEWVEGLGDGIDFEVEELHVDKPRKRSKGIYYRSLILRFLCHRQCNEPPV